MTEQTLAPSPSLIALLEKYPPREKAAATGHMRERIAVALRGSRPSFIEHAPAEAYTLFLYDTQKMRDFHEGWADDFLRCCDVLGLEIVDRLIELERAVGEHVPPAKEG